MSRSDFTKKQLFSFYVNYKKHIDEHGNLNYDGLAKYLCTLSDKEIQFFIDTYFANPDSIYNLQYTCYQFWSHKCGNGSKHSKWRMLWNDPNYMDEDKMIELRLGKFITDEHKENLLIKLKYEELYKELHDKLYEQLKDTIHEQIEQRIPEITENL